MKVIIVDDEVLVRLGIKKYLEDQEDILVTGVFGSAAEALLHMEKEHVDIIITDIEMAEMDGLNFIRSIKSQNYECGIIILSCHDNFEYAREALQLGADRYVLKYEVSEDTLLTEIRKVYREHETALLNKLSIKGSKTGKDSETEETPDLWLNDEPDKKFRIGVLALKEINHTGEGAEKADLEEGMFFYLLEMILAHQEYCEVFSTKLGEIFLLYRFPKGKSEEECRKMTEEIYYRLKQNIFQYTNSILVMGVSNLFDSLPAIRSQYEAAKETLTYRFYGEEKVFYPCQMKMTAIPKLKADHKLLEKREGFNQIKESITEFLAYGKTEQILPLTLKEKLLFDLGNFIDLVWEYYYLTGEDCKNEWKENFRRTMIACPDAEVLKNRVFLCLEQLDAYLLEVLRDEKDFRSVLTFMEEHCEEALTLSFVAGRFYLSVPYFCQLFKEYTGTTFVNYLNECRIRMVKRLLLGSKLSLEEVSMKTGFNNVNYMMRVFKKVTGMTIKDFKNNNQ